MALSLSHTAYATDELITAAKQNTNEQALYNAFSGLEAGTSTLAMLKMDAAPTTDTEVATKAYVDRLNAYRRPSLIYVSATAVDIEGNTATANETTIVFPDGNERSVTENTGSTHKYRRFDITATAEFTTGTEDSGLYTGLTEAVNTTYFIYAVKSAIDTSKFVLVGTTTEPIQANVATLNTNFGTNGWVCIGLIRNGDESGTTGDILNFVQANDWIYFLNTCTGNVSNRPMTGALFAGVASAASLTYTLARGTAAGQVPNCVDMVKWGVNTESGGPGLWVNQTNGSGPYLFQSDDGGQTVTTTIIHPPTSLFATNATNAKAFTIFWMGGRMKFRSSPYANL